MKNNESPWKDLNFAQFFREKNFLPISSLFTVDRYQVKISFYVIYGSIITVER